MHQEEKENTKKKKQSKQHGVLSNRNFIMQIFNLSSLIYAVKSKLWQKLPQSMNELLHGTYLPFISESKQEKTSM